MDISNLIGKKISVKGTAYDAKGGAIVVTEDEDVIYIPEIDEWPANISGKKITLQGILSRAKITPDPVTGSDGAISTGAFGDDYILNDISYK